MQFLLKGVAGFTKHRNEILRGGESVFEQTKIFDEGQRAVLEGHIIDSASRLHVTSLAAKATPTLRVSISRRWVFHSGMLADLIVKEILCPKRINDFERNPLGKSFDEFRS